MNMTRRILSLCLLLALVCAVFGGCQGETTTAATTNETVSLADVPEFDGATAYVVLNDNQPLFTADELTTSSFESYSDLDDLGRCGVAYACIGQDLMPTEPRGSIGQIKPTGWQTVKYDSVDGKYLYNRCHLIGFQLTGENANEKNLITGTRYMNVDGMLPFENLVADYIKETNNHVLYRVTPIFDGSNLVASGVEMEALSVEDDGDGVCYHVYVYNNQPGIVIDYATGASHLAQTSAETSSETSSETQTTYILNTNTMKFHLPTCSSADSIKDENRQSVTTTREALIAEGYSPCKSCNP